MNTTYQLTYRADPEVVLAALKVSPPMQTVRGQIFNKMLRVLHCTLLGLGSLGLGYGVSGLLTGTPTVLHWSTGVGIILLYIAVFGSVFITLPMYVRQVLATRANQGDVTLILDPSGVQSRGQHYQSHIHWAGFEGVGRSKLAILLWFGGNRISIPFTLFDGPAHIDAFEADVNTWMEASR